MAGGFSLSDILHVAMCISMRPPRRDECSGVSHWSVGRCSGPGQGAFAYAGNIQDE